MPPQSGVSVGALLRSRPEAFGLPLDLLAGADGLDRIITSPHIQKTGLALAGFHEYLKPGRVLIFGESEIRYLESLEVAARVASMRLALTLDFPCVMITGGFNPPIELVVEAERARLPLLKTAIATPTAIAKRISTCFTASTYEESVSVYACPWVIVVSAAKSPSATNSRQYRGTARKWRAEVASAIGVIMRLAAR